MSLDQDSLSERRKSKSQISTSSSREPIYDPDFKYLADLVNLESERWAKKGVTQLLKEFREAKSIKKKQRIEQTLIDAEKQAIHMSKSPSLSTDEKDEYVRIAQIFNDAIAKTHDKPTSTTSIKSTDRKREEHLASLRETLDSDRHISEDDKTKLINAINLAEAPSMFDRFMDDFEKNDKNLQRRVEVYWEHMKEWQDWEKDFLKRLEKAENHVDVMGFEHELDREMVKFKERHVFDYGDVQKAEKELIGTIDTISPHIDGFQFAMRDNLWSSVNAFADTFNKKTELEKTEPDRKELDDILLKKRSEVTIERHKKWAKETSPERIIAFTTDKSGFIKLPNGVYLRTSPGGKSNSTTAATFEKELKNRKRVLLRRNEVGGYQDYWFIAGFMAAFGGCNENNSDVYKSHSYYTKSGLRVQQIYTHALPDWMLLDRMKYGKGVGETKGRPKTVMDSAMGAAIVVGGASASYGRLKLPSKTELNNAKKGDPQAAVTLVAGDKKGTKVQSTYSVDYLLRARNLVGKNADLRVGFLGSTAMNDRPLVITDKENKYQIIIAPRVERK